MSSQITASEVQVFWDPCPPEKLPALRHGIRMLFDWLEELGTEEKDQELVKQG